MWIIPCLYVDCLLIPSLPASNHVIIIEQGKPDNGEDLLALRHLFHTTTTIMLAFFPLVESIYVQRVNGHALYT